MICIIVSVAFESKLHTLSASKGTRRLWSLLAQWQSGVDVSINVEAVLKSPLWGKWMSLKLNNIYLFQGSLISFTYLTFHQGSHKIFKLLFVWKKTRLEFCFLWANFQYHVFQDFQEHCYRVLQFPNFY